MNIVYISVPIESADYVFVCMCTFVCVCVCVSPCVRTCVSVPVCVSVEGLLMSNNLKHIDLVAFVIKFNQVVLKYFTFQTLPATADSSTMHLVQVPVLGSQQSH